MEFVTNNQIIAAPNPPDGGPNMVTKKYTLCISKFAQDLASTIKEVGRDQFQNNLSVLRDIQNNPNLLAKKVMMALFITTGK